MGEKSCWNLIESEVGIRWRMKKRTFVWTERKVLLQFLANKHWSYLWSYWGRRNKSHFRIWKKNCKRKEWLNIIFIFAYNLLTFLVLHSSGIEHLRVLNELRLSNKYPQRTGVNKLMNFAFIWLCALSFCLLIHLSLSICLNEYGNIYTNIKYEINSMVNLKGLMWMDENELFLWKFLLKTAFNSNFL